MPTSDPAGERVAVRINPDIWREEVERFDQRSRARIAAERERRKLEEVGVSVARLQRCADEAPDRTRLHGPLKVYVPIGESPRTVAVSSTRSTGVPQ